MPKPNRVILLACSAKKRAVRGMAPCELVYDGPLWSTLRAQSEHNYRRRRPARLVFPYTIALSAKYGFIWSGFQIAPYDQVLTPERATEIVTNVTELKALRRSLYEPGEVFLGGGKLYRETMRRALTAIDYTGTIIEPHPARGIGDIRAGLIAFIDASPLIVPKQASLALT